MQRRVPVVLVISEAATNGYSGKRSILRQKVLKHVWVSNKSAFD